MAEYIERESLIEQINAQKRASKSSYPKQHFVVGDVLTCIFTAPAADVAPVVHAQWKQISEPDEDGDAWYRCTACSSNDLHSPGIAVPYCWHCGAQMDADELQKGAD